MYESFTENYNTLKLLITGVGGDLFFSHKCTNFYLQLIT